MINDLYRKFLIPFHEVFYDLTVCSELSRLMENMEIVTNALMVILSFFETCTLVFLSGHVPWYSCIFWLILWSVFKR